MIVTIEGESEEGKTLLAKSIAEGKKTVNFCGWKVNDLGPFYFMMVQDDTELIIVDDITNYDLFYHTFREPFITIERRGENSYQLKTPNVILIKF